jgi:hypothetical protein
MRRIHSVPIMAASTFNPLRALGSDLIAWWDAGSSYWGSNGGVTTATGVSSWRDIVAAYDLTQGTPASQPVRSGNSMMFDGIDDFFTTTDATLMAALGGSVFYEVWALVRQDSPVAEASTRYIWCVGGSSVTRRAVARSSVGAFNRPRVECGDGTAANAQAPTVIPTLDSRHVVRAIFSAATSGYICEVDGVQAAFSITVPPISTTADRMRIGALSNAAAAGFWFGQIDAVLITLPQSAKSIEVAMRSWLNGRK